MKEKKSFATGLILALVGSIAFSGKAIIVKLAYRHGVDAVTLIMYRMLFAPPVLAGSTWCHAADPDGWAVHL